ncbi:MAG: hypothetical protein QXR09_01975 [Candidatus Aenigmatarchaeota archaeon]
MTLINKINLNDIHANVRKIINLTFDIRLLQDQLEDVINYISSNKKYLESGKISKEMYEENQLKLEEGKKILIEKINKKVELLVKVAEKSKQLIGSNKI